MSASLWWVVIVHEHTERDTFVGPFHTLERAKLSMQDSSYVQGLCEEDCIDCYVNDAQPDLEVQEVLIINPFEPHFTGEPEPEDDEPGPGLTLIEVPVRDPGVSRLTTKENTGPWPSEDERPAYADWQGEVANGDTVLGFRDWLTAQAADECEGHESLAGEHMGETVYCDGTCRS